MMSTPAAPSSSAAPPCFHSLPIQTGFEGTTDVHANFTGVMTRDLKAALWHANLRGRHLVGAEVTLPEDYAVALVDVRDTTARASPYAAFHTEREETATEMTVEAFVQVAAPSFMQWDHDQPPAAAATLPQWIALAALLHSTEPPPASCCLHRNT